MKLVTLGFMSKSTERIAQLQAAATAEVRKARERLERYEALTQKIVDYQAGNGGAPTVEEFTAWCEDVELAIAIRKLNLEGEQPLAD